MVLILNSFLVFTCHFSLLTQQDSHNSVTSVHFKLNKLIMPSLLQQQQKCKQRHSNNNKTSGTKNCICEAAVINSLITSGLKKVTELANKMIIQQTTAV